MANRLTSLGKGFPGKPSHPPLTDASIGAYTVGVAMLVLGALGVEEEQMAHGALLAIGGGLALALPTALTGLLDWLALPKGTPTKTVATTHLITMLAATVVFALTFIAHLDGYDDGEVEALPLILGLVAESLLADEDEAESATPESSATPAPKPPNLWPSPPWIRLNV